MKSEEAREYQVKEFMGKKIRTIGSGSSVHDAVEIMVDNGIGSVVDDDGATPRGLFTERGLLRTLAKA